MSSGQLIPDDELVLYILGGLGPKYEYVIVNLSSNDSVTLSETQFMLQAHELRLASFNSSQVLEINQAIAQLIIKDR